MKAGPAESSIRAIAERVEGTPFTEVFLEIESFVEKFDNEKVFFDVLRTVTSILLPADPSVTALRADLKTVEYAYGRLKSARGFGSSSFMTFWERALAILGWWQVKLRQSGRDILPLDDLKPQVIAVVELACALSLNSHLDWSKIYSDDVEPLVRQAIDFHRRGQLYQIDVEPEVSRVGDSTSRAISHGRSLVPEKVFSISSPQHNSSRPEA